jgi:hypothetical protein
MEDNYKEQAEMLSRQLEEAKRKVESQRKEIEYLKDKSKPSYLYLQSGSTPMTIAELVCKECLGDNDTLKDVVYFINCYIDRYNSDAESEGEDAT